MRFAQHKDPGERIERMASDRIIYNVVPNVRAKAWAVTQQHGDFHLEFTAKEEAVTFAKQCARAHEPSQVKVHNQDGNMEYESTYDEDSERSWR
ncbi:MAG: hypothetical protein JWN13_4521 [Betaproteobacteria bacterium]|jgi:hypothetical protein|nr:hypothetical protein [Betaproteobacteria bacterium]MEA3153183.1 hypothetical protein [Betaproteobacteria bacterium]